MTVDSGEALPATGEVFIDALLIEDSDSDCFLIQESVRRMPLKGVFRRYDTVESAIVGLRDPGFAIPHCILLDLNLPCGDGIDVLRVIRENEKLAPVPVFVLTSSVSPRDVEKAQSLGITAFLQKPTQFQEFVNPVQGVFGDVRESRSGSQAASS